MKYLKLDRVDLLRAAWDQQREILDWSLKKDGCLAAARRLQKEGRTRFHRLFHARHDRHHSRSGEHRRV